MSFDEARSKVEDSYLLERKYKRSMAFVNDLRARISAGENPDSLLFFLGGWTNVKNLDSAHIFDDIEYSNLIVNDMVKKHSNYVSHIMKLNENDYFFYKLISLQKIETSEMKSLRKTYRKKMTADVYKKWMAEYASEIGVHYY